MFCLLVCLLAFKNFSPRDCLSLISETGNLVFCEAPNAFLKFVFGFSFRCCRDGSIVKNKPDALAKDLSPVPRTHMVAHKLPITPASGYWT